MVSAVFILEELYAEEIFCERYLGELDDIGRVLRECDLTCTQAGMKSHEINGMPKDVLLMCRHCIW